MCSGPVSSLPNPTTTNVFASLKHSPVLAPIYFWLSFYSETWCFLFPFLIAVVYPNATCRSLSEMGPPTLLYFHLDSQVTLTFTCQNFYFNCFLRKLFLWYLIHTSKETIQLITQAKSLALFPFLHILNIIKCLFILYSFIIFKCLFVFNFCIHFL